jgi:hypothetical protein
MIPGIGIQALIVIREFWGENELGKQLSIFTITEEAF